jgi:hypothetical protein
MLRGILALITVGILVGPLAAASAPSVREWHFDDVPVDGLPPGFIVGSFFDGRPAGDWKVADA